MGWITINKKKYRVMNVPEQHLEWCGDEPEKMVWSDKYHFPCFNVCGIPTVPCEECNGHGGWFTLGGPVSCSDCGTIGEHPDVRVCKPSNRIVELTADDLRALRNIGAELVPDLSRIHAEAFEKNMRLLTCVSVSNRCTGFSRVGDGMKEEREKELKEQRRGQREEDG